MACRTQEAASGHVGQVGRETPDRDGTRRRRESPPWPATRRYADVCTHRQLACEVMEEGRVVVDGLGADELVERVELEAPRRPLGRAAVEVVAHCQGMLKRCSERLGAAHLRRPMEGVDEGGV